MGFRYPLPSLPLGHGVRWPEREKLIHPLQSCAEVTNTWSCTFAPPYVFMSTALRVTWPLFGGAATKWHSWQAFCVLGEGSVPAADGGKEAQLVRGL